jgi:hypothetical protein
VGRGRGRVMIIALVFAVCFCLAGFVLAGRVMGIHL